MERRVALLSEEAKRVFQRARLARKSLKRARTESALSGELRVRMQMSVSGHVVSLSMEICCEVVVRV